ncbi:hypothetical protein GW17_00008285 [Ensete ventricosum]|nr:hypothetical protein GW17_00008285 [Ensete ventricosum]RZR82049.1 hypothetical protein BHM03_00008380 [Ensete ventricosum]
MLLSSAHLPPTAAPVASVSPPVTAVPPSFVVAAASNRTLCRYRSLLPCCTSLLSLLHLLVATAAPPCSLPGCRSNRCPSPPGTYVPPCHYRQPPSSSSLIES